MMNIFYALQINALKNNVFENAPSLFYRSGSVVFFYMCYILLTHQRLI